MNIEDAIYNQGYHIIDDFLEEHYHKRLQNIIKTFDEEGLLKQAKIGHLKGHMQNLMIRRDKIHWIDEWHEDEAIQVYIHRLNGLSKLLNESLFLGLHDFEAHFAIYKAGDFYKKHVDQLHNTSERRISCVYYLNDQWNDLYGGELKLYHTNGHALATIMPESNRFVCFKSELPHEVAVTSHPRYSIAAWLKSRKIAE